MVLWPRIGVVLFFCGALAACGEPDPAENIEWAIDPEVTGADRELMRKALAIVFEECPALAEVDWEAAVTGEGDYAKVINHGAGIREAGPDFVDWPMIEGWRRFGWISYHPPPPATGSDYWYLDFSWDEPPGIAAHGNEENDPGMWWGTWRGVQECDLTEFVPAAPSGLRSHFNHWFRRIDRLGEITAEAPPKAE